MIRNIEISIVGNGSTWKNRDTNSRRLLLTITMLYNTNIIIAHDKVRNLRDTEWPVQETTSSHTTEFPCRGLMHIQRINDSSAYWIQDRSNTALLTHIRDLHLKFLADVKNATAKRNWQQLRDFETQYYRKFFRTLHCVPIFAANTENPSSYATRIVDFRYVVSEHRNAMINNRLNNRRDKYRVESKIHISRYFESMKSLPPEIFFIHCCNNL